MQFATFKDLRLKTAEVLGKAGGRESIVITRRGRPVAVLIPATEASLEEVLRAAAAARLRSTVAKAGEDAARSGTARMTPGKINSVIRKARAARHG